MRNIKNKKDNERRKGKDNKRKRERGREGVRKSNGKTKNKQ